MRARGFTLIEMVIAITLIGVLSVAAIPMLRIPMATWMEASRRGGLAQAIDSADARLRDDMARAMPNSVRIRQVAGRVLLETLEMRAWGRLRAGPSGAAQACPATCLAAGNNDALEAGCNDNCFTSLGPLQGAAPLPGDWVVVNPLGPGIVPGDPYFGGNATVANGIKSALVSMAAAPDGQRLNIIAHNFPGLSPADSRRFYIAATPVTWDCDPVAQRLTRRWGYPMAAVQPLAFGAAPSAPLLDRVAACSIVYTAAGGAGRGGVLQVRIRMSAPTDIAAPETAELNTTYVVKEGA